MNYYGVVFDSRRKPRSDKEKRNRPFVVLSVEVDDEVFLEIRDDVLVDEFL